MRKQAQRLENLLSHSASLVKLVNWKLGHEAPPSLLPVDLLLGNMLPEHMLGPPAGSSQLTPLKLRPITGSSKDMFMYQGQNELFPRLRTGDKIFGSLLRFRVPRGDCISVKGHGGGMGWG